MKSKIAAFLLAVSMANVAIAETLTFEDLSDTTLWHMTPMPTSYGGLHWIGWSYYSWDNPPWYNAASGVTRIGHPAVRPGYGSNANAIYTDSPVAPFVFEGVSVAGFNDPINFPYAPMSVSFQLFRNGTKVGQSAWLSPSATPTFLASGYAGEVDRVEMIGNTAYAVLDDFKFHFVGTPDPWPVVPPPGTGGTGSSGDDSGSYAAPVPEPETYALMLAGLGLMGFVVRRRKRI
jgi:hypothetical protein